MTQGDVLLRLFTRIPSPQSISELETGKESNAIRFVWRGVKYKIDFNYDSLMVDEVNGSMLASTDRAELIKQLLKIDIK